MDEKFVFETQFDLKKRIDIVRAYMGRVYYGFLLVAAAVVCFNYYLISSGKAVQGDEKKTVTLFVLMVIWAFVPVIGGILWNTISKVKSCIITVYGDKVNVQSDSRSFELTPDRFYNIMEREHYIKFGPLKETVIIDIKDVKIGNGEEAAKFLRDME